MTENENKVKQDSEKSEKISEHNQNIVDTILSKNKRQTVDSETMILETQKRVWGALKKGYEYLGVVDDNRLVTGEEGCLFTIDLEFVKNKNKEGLFDPRKMSESVKENIQSRLNELENIIKS